jgi:hypothetical protein
MKNPLNNGRRPKINYLTVFFIGTTIILLVLLIMNQSKSTKTEEYTSDMILSKIVYLQELSLVKYNYTGVISYKDYYKILNINVPLTEKSFLIKYGGYVKAGVDFSRIKVDVDNRSVHVSVPKAKILDTVIDENSVKVYDESQNAFNPIKITDYNEALKKEKNTMIDDALKQGILKEANEQAKLAISALLQGLGFEKIEVTEEIALPELH